MVALMTTLLDRLATPANLHGSHCYATSGPDAIDASPLAIATWAAIAAADRKAAPSYGETLPEWRRRAILDLERKGFVAVWASSEVKVTL